MGTVIPWLNEAAIPPAIKNLKGSLDTACARRKPFSATSDGWKAETVVKMLSLRILQLSDALVLHDANFGFKIAGEFKIRFENAMALET